MPSVVRASVKAGSGLDPTLYPIEEKVGEDLLQRWIMELLRPLIDRWLRHRGVTALVGADQFIYYRPYAPTLRVAPDIYVLPGVRPDTRVSSWKTWEKGVVPSFVLEIASRDWEKDYAEAPEKYGEVGVDELLIFDPAPERHPYGVTWQVYRRVGGRPLRKVDIVEGDRVKSKTLGCFLRAVGQGDTLRLRLGTGVRGDELFPTMEEAERAAKEAAIEARDIAQRRVAELEARLRRGQRPPPR